MRGVVFCGPPENLPQVAGYYSQLAAVLAGFSFAGLIALLTTHRGASANDPQFRSIGPLIAAFVGLVASSLDYALLAGEPAGTARVASLQTMAGLGFAVAGIMMIYSLLVLMSDLRQGASTPRAGVADAISLLRNLLVLVLPPLFVLLMWSGVTDHVSQKYGSGSLFGNGLNRYGAAVLAAVTVVVIVYRITLFRAPRQQRRLPVIVTRSAVVLAVLSLIGSALQITLTTSDRSVNDLVPAAALTLVAIFSLLASYSASRYSTDMPNDPRAEQGNSLPVVVPAPRPLVGPPDVPVTDAEERARQIEAGILEPLDQDVLVRRSVDIFPQGYLTNISIIQGVALAAIVAESTRFLRDAPAHLLVPALAQSLLDLTALIVVSYEYLWFTTIVRWAPTFRDTAIPVVLGIGEIVPAYLLDRPVAWWFAFATFALLGCGAFGNTVLRLREDYFPRHRDSYRAVRTLLLRLMHLCMTAVGTSVVVALLIRALPRTATLIAVVAAGGLILIIAAAMVGYSEYVLNDVYRKFGIGRRPPLFQRWNAALRARAADPVAGQGAQPTPPGP
jgi:hypothetical protein